MLVVILSRQYIDDDDDDDDNNANRASLDQSLLFQKLLTKCKVRYFCPKNNKQAIGLVMKYCDCYSDKDETFWSDNYLCFL